MNKQTLQTNLACLACLLATGLGTPPARAAEDFTEEFHQTYPLTAEGCLSVDNVNGFIHISTWDRAEVKLDAVKRANQKADLASLKIEIEAKPDQLRVHTKHPNTKGWLGNRSLAVDYTLTVPASARLDKISAVNGTVTIDGVRGPVKAATVNGTLHAAGLAAATDLSTVNGTVQASFVDVDEAKSVSISTVNGKVDLHLPQKANADLSASAVNGSIRGDVPVKKNWPVGSEVKTRLGDGGTKVHASAVNGAIEIRLDPPAKTN